VSDHSWHSSAERQTRVQNVELGFAMITLGPRVAGPAASAGGVMTALGRGAGTARTASDMKIASMSPCVCSPKRVPRS